MVTQLARRCGREGQCSTCTRPHRPVTVVNRLIPTQIPPHPHQKTPGHYHPALRRLPLVHVAQELVLQMECFQLSCSWLPTIDLEHCEDE